MYLWPEHSPSLTEMYTFLWKGKKHSISEEKRSAVNKKQTDLNRYACIETNNNSGSNEKLVLMWMEMPYMHVMCTPCTTGRSCSTLWMLANAFPRLERTKSSYGNRVTTQFTTGFLFRHFFWFFSFSSVCLPNCKSSIVFYCLKNFIIRANEFLTGVRPFILRLSFFWFLAVFILLLFV